MADEPPRKKRKTPAKKVGKKKRSGSAASTPEKALRASRQASAMFEIEAEVLMGPANALVVVPLPPMPLSDAVRRRDWAAIIGGEQPVTRLETLVELVGRPEAASESWSDVLLKAGIPWMAWSILRDDVPEARDLFEAWKRMKADTLVHEAQEKADNLDDEGVGVGESGVAWNPHTGSRVQIALRKWLAERLDPTTYGSKQHVTKDVRSLEVKRVEIHVVDESGG